MKRTGKTLPLIPLILLFVFPGIFFTDKAWGEDPGDIRPSVLAGTWYPGDRETLLETVNSFLSGVSPTPSPGKEIKGVLVPHAGYRYSGRIAAFAYRALVGAGFRRVVLIGPSHRYPFRGVSVNLQGGYQTPLGVVPVDVELGRRLAGTSPIIRWVPRAHAAEHSLEIQLPFLQRVLGEFQIVPVLMGEQDLETCMELAGSLVKVLGSGEGTLLLASSDLSHFHPAKEAEVLDGVFIRHVKAFDPKALARALGSGECEACGGGPVVAVMMAAGELGAVRSEILCHGHSGQVTGDFRRVVGYLSALFLAGE